MRATPRGDQLLYELGMLFARCRRLVWTAAARRLEENGYSPLWWGLLAYLSHHGPSTQREIAGATGQHPASISRLVDDLLEARLVRRGRDEQDRRRARVELTARGRSVFDATRPHVLSGLREAFAPLSAPEQRRLFSLLMKLMPCAEEAGPVSRPRKSIARKAQRSSPRAITGRGGSSGG